MDITKKLRFQWDVIMVGIEELGMFWGEDKRAKRESWESPQGKGGSRRDFMVDRTKQGEEEGEEGKGGWDLEDKGKGSGEKVRKRVVNINRNTKDSSRRCRRWSRGLEQVWDISDRLSQKGFNVRDNLTRGGRGRDMGAVFVALSDSSCFPPFHFDLLIFQDVTLLMSLLQLWFKFLSV